MVWYPAPSPFVQTRLVQTRPPHVSALLGLFWNHRFCGPNPVENVACAFVQAARRVTMGGKVLVQLQFHARLCPGVYAGLLLCIVMF